MEQQLTIMDFMPTQINNNGKFPWEIYYLLAAHSGTGAY